MELWVENKAVILFRIYIYLTTIINAVFFFFLILLFSYAILGISIIWLMNSVLNCTWKPILHSLLLDSRGISLCVQFNAKFPRQVMNFPLILNLGHLLNSIGINSLDYSVLLSALGICFSINFIPNVMFLLPSRDLLLEQYIDVARTYLILVTSEIEGIRSILYWIHKPVTPKILWEFLSLLYTVHCFAIRIWFWIN